MKRYALHVPLSERQRQCIIALDKLERETPEGHSAHIYGCSAGEIASAAGFSRGPVQHGNGAKDGRSWSGYGSPAKYVTFSLYALVEKGHVETLSLHEGRSFHFRLTEQGRTML
jgi:hypothetical protein